MTSHFCSVRSELFVLVLHQPFLRRMNSKNPSNPAQSEHIILACLLIAYGITLARHVCMWYVVVLGFLVCFPLV